MWKEEPSRVSDATQAANAVRRRRPPQTSLEAQKLLLKAYLLCDVPPDYEYGGLDRWTKTDLR